MSLPHCHCFCHCPSSVASNPSRPTQFLEGSSPGTFDAPFFGSAIFSFNNRLTRPRINAHISVLFIDESEEEGGPNSLPNLAPRRDEIHEANLGQADKGNSVEESNPQKDGSERPPAKAEEAATTELEEDYYKPCPIVEEELEE